MTIREELLEKSTEYLQSFDDLEGMKPPVLLVDFVIEKFQQVRNYPNTFSEEKIDQDMHKYLSTMAMAVVDIFSKCGAEGEKSHSENGIVRTYENAYISSSVFNDVLPLVKVLL